MRALVGLLVALAVGYLIYRRAWVMERLGDMGNR